MFWTRQQQRDYQKRERIVENNNAKQARRDRIFAEAERTLRNGKTLSEETKSDIKKLCVEAIEKSNQFANANGGGSRTFQLGGLLAKGMNLTKLAIDFAKLETAAEPAKNPLGFTLADLYIEAWWRTGNGAGGPRSFYTSNTASLHSSGTGIHGPRSFGASGRMSGSTGVPTCDALPPPDPLNPSFSGRGSTLEEPGPWSEPPPSYESVVGGR